MEIKYSKKKDALTVFLCGELDEYSAKYARDALDELIDENLTCKKVVFDMSKVTFMDSTGIGLLIGRYKKLKTFSIETYITGAGVSTEKVIELAGLYNIMPKY